MPVVPGLVHNIRQLAEAIQPEPDGGDVDVEIVEGPDNEVADDSG